MVYLWGRVVMVFLRTPLVLPLTAPSRPAPVEGADRPKKSRWGGGGVGVWCGEEKGKGRTKWEGESCKEVGRVGGRIYHLSIRTRICLVWCKNALLGEGAGPGIGEL